MTAEVGVEGRSLENKMSKGSLDLGDVVLTVLTSEGTGCQSDGLRAMLLLELGVLGTPLEEVSEGSAQTHGGLLEYIT